MSWYPSHGAYYLFNVSKFCYTSEQMNISTPNGHYTQQGYNIQLNAVGCNWINVSVTDGDGDSIENVMVEISAQYSGNNPFYETEVVEAVPVMFGEN